MTERARQPRIVRKELFATDAWRTAQARLAQETGQSERVVLRHARRYLKELLPGASDFSKSVLIRFGRFVYRRGYDHDIKVDPEQVEGLRALATKHPVAFVSNHRSQVDSFAIFCALHDNDLPHPVTFGGINMKIPVMGNILKNGGLVFIRRAFQDNPVYKTVLRAYIDYLVERGLPLFWAIEGTRSRTGKLVPPRFGLMNWVLDAHERMSRRDLMIVPIVASYDQIADVNSYSEQERGGAKKPEDFRWLVEYLRGFKQKLGPITVHFGKPVSVKEHTAAFEATHPEKRGSRKSAVPSIVVEACNHMNAVTPVTGPSLITMTILGAIPHAMTLKDLRGKFDNLVRYTREHGWPATFDLTGANGDALKESLDALVESGVLDLHDVGRDSVYSVARDRELYASYYRNNSLHFFVPGAIAELAYVAATREEISRAAVEDHAWRLRNLLRYEFYFPPKVEFLQSVVADLDIRVPGWLDTADSEAAWTNLGKLELLLSHMVLPSFLEAYQIVAREIELGDDDSFDRRKLIGACINNGEQLYRLGKISNREAIAKAMFDTGMHVAQRESQERLSAVLHDWLDSINRVRQLSCSELR